MPGVWKRNKTLAKAGSFGLILKGNKMIEALSGKIHHAVVTDSNKEYVGSITIAQELLDAANILQWQKVLVACVESGERFETYAMPGKPGEIIVNGAAANKVKKGERLIIMAFHFVEPHWIGTNRTGHEAVLPPKIVIVDANNKIVHK